MVRFLAWFALAAFVGASVGALAQSHDHPQGKNGEMFVILHDGPVQGRALVSGLTHFGFALVDRDGVPVRHHDATFTLVQNGVTLFSTRDTHEYDGLFSFEYTFAVPGPYEVRAESDTGVAASFTGEAVLPRDAFPVTVEVALPERARVGQAAPITVRVLDGAGEIVPHSDALVEVRRVDDGLLVFRTHLHTHEAPMDLALAFDRAGEYAIEAIGYLAFPTGRGPEFTTAAARAVLKVDSTLPVRAAAPLVAPRALAAKQDPGHNHDGAQGPDYVLSLTLDPDARSGPFNHQRMSALVWDGEAGRALQHVNFEASLTGPDGFTPAQSASLHEYDGHLEWVVSGLAPGEYVWRVKAQYRNWTKEAETKFTVLPPFYAVANGPMQVASQGFEGLSAGEPREVSLAMANAAGVTIPHSEVEFTIVKRGEVSPLAQTKLHTHDAPVKFTIAFPTEGEYELRADADALMPSAPLFLSPDGLAQTSVLKIVVAPGPGLPGVVTPPLLPAGAGPGAEAKVPAPGFFALAIAGVAVALATARHARRDR